MITDRLLVQHLNKFFSNIAPICSFEEYKLTFYLFLFLDHYSRQIINNFFVVYLNELINGFPNQTDFKNIYAPIGLTHEQIFKAVIEVNQRSIFNVTYSKGDKLLKVKFMGI